MCTSTPPSLARQLAAPGSRAAIAAILWLTPLLAHAEEHDASEWGHGLVVMGLLFMIFLTCFSVAIWLLIVRIRSTAAASTSQGTGVRPNLERLWFPRN